MKALLALALLGTSQFAVSSALAAAASDEIKLIIACNEAMDGKSSGVTDKLAFDSTTPIAYVATKKIYFLTDKSIYSLENKYRDQDIVVHLTNNDKDFYRKLNINKDGKIGNISYDEIKDKKDALEPKAQLDEDTLGLFKKDLITRVNSMQGEYQNKFDPQDTLNAIKICDEVKSPEMQKATAKQTAYYEKLLKKPSAYSDGLKKSKKSSGQQ
ncbi:MAG: hypothetical protein JSU04_11080 [Bdellovibrionales bacterium]|nr:hypothetical protein [Bdellovibrionales bacterium]